MAIKDQQVRQEDKKHFLLIDGSSLLFRAFYAIKNLTTKDGIYTNGVYGFLTMYAKAVEMIKPAYVMVAFDRSGPTFRTKDYEEYKGTRDKAPEELSAQFGILKDVLDALNIKHIDMDSYEADDIIGTLAKQNEDKNIENFLLTGDRDYFQLVDFNTKVLYTKRGITDLEIVDEDYVRDKYGVDPAQLIDVKGLQGDTSDNIPGVPGVGEKTALKLIKEYGSLEGVYDHLEDVSGKKLKENLENNYALALLSKRLGTIFTEIPMELKTKDFAVTEPNQVLLKDRFQRLEFNSLAEKFALETEAEETEVFQAHWLEEAETDAFIEEVEKAGELAMMVLSSQDNYIQAKPLYVALKPKGKETRLIDLTEPSAFDEDSFKKVFGFIFQEERIKKLCYGVKKDIVLLKKIAIDFDDLYEDVMLMEYLIDPSRTSYTIADLADRALNMNISTLEMLLGKGKKKKEFDQVEEGDLLDYCGSALQVLEQAAPILRDELDGLNMVDLYRTIENPLAKVLARMEEVGIEADVSVLDDLHVDFSARLKEIEKNIYDQAGHEFNINSPKQLGDILFEEMGLPHGKKTKTGYSTAADVLEGLKHVSPIIPEILQYRQLSKLMSTYVEGLKPYIDEDKRIRSIFRQTVAATGRISSTEPNLQNIPIRTEEGRKLRAVFVAKPGHVLIDADYSQIELRVLASLAQDKAMIQAFKEGQDIHAKTASEVGHKPIEEVTPLERSHAKAVNFGIIYGISDYGLSQDLGISRKEAKEYIDNYKNAYPQIKAYMEHIVEQAKEDGYVDTFYGRRRSIPELTSKNFSIRNFGERIALNTPIQGTAADIIKIAMNRVDKELEQRGYKSRLVLQVHDELIIEAPEEEAEEVGQLIVDLMETVGSFEVDLVADMDIAKSWYDV